MPTAPPTVVEQAILGATSRVTRRAEIYESDGVTLWTGAGTESRLIEGQVTIDYSRDERRAVELTLDNADLALVHDPDGGFWYDKVIKVYRGVEVNEPWRPPSIVIIEDAGENRGQTLKNILAQIGYTDVDIRLSLTTLADVAGYDILVSLANYTITQKSQLIRDFYNGGGRVFTSGNDSTAGAFPEIIGTDAAKTSADAYTIKPNSITSPLVAGWTAESEEVDTGRIVTAVASGATAISTTTMTDGTANNIISRSSTNGGRWVHLHPYTWGVQAQNFIRTAFQWLNPVELVGTWEVQIGEFLIDSIKEAHFPHRVKVTGRDYTKKCIQSKYVVATSYASGQSIESLIKTIAQNAGITKFLLPTTGQIVGKSFFFDADYTRWQAMKDIANAYGYDVFFDAQGYLVLEEFQDPITAPLTYVLETGQYGNLVTYEKATNDTRIYNHIVVTGESSDQNTIPVSAEAKNTEPSSPTRIARLGDRVYRYTSSFITTQAQAQDVADKFLKIHALEEYDLNFSSICLPWLEVGEIVQFVDPNAGPSDPDRFLLSSLTIPLGLGPMSGDAKRVTVIT